LSTSNPDSGNTPAAGQQSSSASSAGKPAGKFWAIAAGIALVVGVGGFFIGSAVKQSDYDKGGSGYKKIYAQAYADGSSAGTAAGNAQGQRVGKAQGEQIGRQAGVLVGKSQGMAAGEAKGRQEGIAAGASAALGGLVGWNTDVPYIVELNPSPVKGVPYQIYSRTLMREGYNYFLCPNGKTICHSPLTK
jgi:hypothetical protein